MPGVAEVLLGGLNESTEHGRGATKSKSCGKGNWK
jgi:hypothetical protein